MDGMSLWPTNKCKECLSSLEKGNEWASSSKYFEILQDRYPCIVNPFALYT